MPRIRVIAQTTVLCFFGLASSAAAQTIDGDNLALQSSGAASGTGWTLSTDGYVGTYIQVTKPTPVTFGLDASGQASAGLAPDMTISIANDNQSFSVNSASLNNYSYTTPTLPAGNYFVRVQLDNQTATATPSLTVGDLQVSGNGVSVNNADTDANALAAAQSYINNFRQGPMNLTLLGPGNVPLAAGTQVQVKMVQNAFSLGTAVYDTNETNNFYSTYPWLAATAASTGNTALAYKYQQFVLNNFNTVEPENAGKWVSNEFFPGSVNMTFVDELSNFAEENKLNVRMHNLIWTTQQPFFIDNDFANNDVSAINSAVTSRIGYYVSGDNSQPGPADGQPRTLAYSQMDVLNEGLHPASGGVNYIGTLGYAGVANIYSQVQKAVAAAGGNTRLYTNEYNVLQNSSSIGPGGTGAPDPYANWYLKEIDTLNNSGYGKVVTGVGSELYVPAGETVSPTQMQEAMQNLAVTGNPFSLTEFGIGTGESGPNLSSDLTNAFTMVYGNPNATTFDFFDFWKTLEANDSFLDGFEGGALMDANGNPTPLYTNVFLPMLAADGFLTPSQMTPMDLTVGANGQINFSGSYGTYEVILDGQDYLFTSSPTGNTFSLMVSVPEPASAGVLALGGTGLCLRRRKIRR